MSYARFGAMILTSTIVMFGLMYLNTYALDHVWFSQTRAWMAVVMGAAMAVIMLGFMLGMYRNKQANLAILVGAVLAFAAALFLVRSQETVGDVSYMKAMIPHHSIAIMTSERAHIRDPRVRKLADGIIQAQVREIAEMEQLIADLKRLPFPPMLLTCCPMTTAGARARPDRGGEKFRRAANSLSSCPGLFRASNQTLPTSKSRCGKALLDRRDKPGDDERRGRGHDKGEGGAMTMAVWSFIGWPRSESLKGCRFYPCSTSNGSATTRRPSSRG